MKHYRIDNGTFVDIDFEHAENARLLRERFDRVDQAKAKPEDPEVEALKRVEENKKDKQRMIKELAVSIKKDREWDALPNGLTKKKDTNNVAD